MVEWDTLSGKDSDGTGCCQSEVLSKNLHGGNKKTMKDLSQYKRRASPDSNRKFLEYMRTAEEPCQPVQFKYSNFAV